MKLEYSSSVQRFLAKAIVGWFAVRECNNHSNWYK